MKTISKPVLIYMPLDLIEQVDQISSKASLSRSEQVRQSLRRDLDFIVQHESIRDASHAQNVRTEYLTWRRSNQNTSQ